MGTNYYVRGKKPCKVCKRGFDDDIHLGKSSMGWRFSFQLNRSQFYHDIPSMKVWLKGRVIWDEYNKKISKKEFWEMVEFKQQNPGDSSGRSIIIGGYEFYDMEFS